jgi:hypothetical protein
MTALEIAAGVTSLIVVAFYILKAIGAFFLNRRLVIVGPDFALMVAGIFGAAWFAARLWGFA